MGCVVGIDPVAPPLPTTCKRQTQFPKCHVFQTLFWSILGATIRERERVPLQTLNPLHHGENLKLRARVQVCCYSSLLTRALYVAAWDNPQVLSSLSLTGSAFVIVGVGFFLISQCKFFDNLNIGTIITLNIFLWGICNWKLLPLLKSTAFYVKYTIHIQQKRIQWEWVVARKVF